MRKNLMMSLRKLIIFLTVVFCGLIFGSCSNRKDFISSLDIKPQILLKVGDSSFHQYQDSLKINPKLNGYSVVDLKFSGLDGISSLIYHSEKNIGSLKYKNDSILNNTLNPSYGETILKYITKIEGLSEFHFIVRDKFQGTDSAIYRVLSFKNLIPIAKATITPSRTIDPLEYILDASGSIDPDRNFGGGIIQYIFFVNGQTIQSTEPIIKYIFPQPGQYTINLQVIDNDQASSPILSLSALIN